MRGLHCLDGYGVLLLPGGRRQRQVETDPAERERHPAHILRVKRDHAMGQAEATVARLVGSEADTTVIAN